MLWSDFVRFGGLAAGFPAAGAVWQQLWHDYATGRKARPAADFARLTGLGTKQVARVFDRLVDWGLATKQRRKVLVSAAPNRRFCEAVVTGLYGHDVLQRLESGALAAELLPVSGPTDPVVGYAVQSVLALYGKLDLYATSLPEPSEAAGTGYVGEMDFCAMDLRSTSLYEGSVVVIQTLRVEENSRAEVQFEKGTARAEVQFSVYKADFSPTLVVENPVKQQVRAARTKRYETIPVTSSGFVYWPNERLAQDTQYYQPVLDLLAYWNDLAETGERLTWKLYIPVRTLLAEEGLDPADLQRAFRLLATDDFWSGKLSLYKLANNVHLIREALSSKRVDRFARTMPAQPQGDMQVYQF